MLPAPFRHHSLEIHGGELADAHVFVKYAVRYKGAGETVATRAWPLSAPSVTELLEAVAVEVDESALTEGVLAGAGARGVEKVLKERLPDKLGYTQLSDPVTQEASRPPEDEAAFVARLQEAGAGAKVERLAAQLEKKRRDLAALETDLAGRKQEKWMAIGTAILSNIGLVTGRKRTLSGASTVLSKNRMENTAEARVEALRAEIETLEAQHAEQSVVDPTRFEDKRVVPARSDVKLRRYDLVWVY